MQLARAARRFPNAYRSLHTPCIPKKGEKSKPLDHRLLAVYSSIYRIEMAAQYVILKPWLYANTHDSLSGGIAGREPVEAAWDAQSDLEHSLLNGLYTAMASYDYYKFFDSFNTEFTRRMLRHVGMPDDLADAWCDLHVNTTRTIRYGSTLERCTNYSKTRLFISCCNYLQGRSFTRSCLTY